MKKILLLTALLTLVACSPKEEDFKTDVPETSPAEQSAETQVESELDTSGEESGEDVETAEGEEVSENTETEEGSQLPAQSLPSAKTESSQLEEIPAEINLTAPFYSQAPEGDWSQPWQDACEEASLILAHYGMKGESLTQAEFKQLVLDMVDWEMEHFGYFESTTVDQVVQMYEGFFEDAFEVKVIDNPTVDDMKAELAQGHLIVAPFAGRQLGNPFYSGEGPYYHMMVMKGYDEKHFITNDVGTKRGENFIYDYQTILDSMHDYKEPGIEEQPAKIIVLLDV